MSIIAVLFMRESYAYVILDRKAKRLRKETGNLNLRSVLDTGKSPRDLFAFSIVRPTKMLFLSPIVFLLSLYVAVIYGYLYLLFTTMTTVFEDNYGFSQGSVGLAYLGIGCGSLIGLFALGLSSDRLHQYLTKKNGGVPKPEYRLPPMIIGSWFIPLALFWYGWTAEKHDHWILPILGTSCLGIGMLMAFVGFCLPLLNQKVVDDSANMRCLDVYVNISRRRIHDLLCVRNSRQHRLSLPTRSTAAACWKQNVCYIGSWVGKLGSRFYCAGSRSIALGLLQVRRTDSQEQTVPG